jgi:hypothetical protein
MEKEVSQSLLSSVRWEMKDLAKPWEAQGNSTENKAVQIKNSGRKERTCLEYLVV